MGNFDYREFYRRRLPHIQPQGATLFVTFRLAGSLPQHVLEKLHAMDQEAERRRQAIADADERARRKIDDQKRSFARFDVALDALDGPVWLSDPAVSNLVKDALHFRDPAVYRLDAYCIMPNHIHVVLSPELDEDGQPLALQKILHSLKRYTALKANELLGRQGTFWQHESYDHYVRDHNEWRRLIGYVVDNPVRAGLVRSWDDWPWTYLRMD